MRALVTAAVVAGLAGSSLASDQVRFYDTDSNGGEDGFVADLSGNGFDNPTGDFVTFCVEVVETFSYGTVYDYGSSLEVRDNGGNGNTSLDTVDGRRVAKLYRIFDQGGEAAVRALAVSLGAFNDSETRSLMQRFIWDRFSFPNGDNWANGTYTDAMFDDLEAALDVEGAQSGLHGVRVMNIYAVGGFGDENQGSQDMLIIIPLPSGAGLAGLGLLGIAAAGRRRRMS